MQRHRENKQLQLSEEVIQLEEDEREVGNERFIFLKMSESYEIPIDTPKAAPTASAFKKINELTDDEYNKIVSDIESGLVSPHYELKKFKTVPPKLVYKKQPTTRQKAVERTMVNSTRTDQNIYLTDAQLMQERLFELENKVTKLQMKNKKRKNQINEIMESAYYVDADEYEEEVEVQKPPEQTEVQTAVPNKSGLMPFPHSARNWRSKFRQ
jgi:hypothetical protein